MRGTIFNIQRCSLQDGPGIRTTVFMKGCPLRCEWCHNPESWRREPELSYFKSKCVSCGICADVCPTGAHGFSEPGGHEIDRSRCTACGICARKCCHDALSVIGEERTAESVIEEALRDKPFYERSGGGMTLSGGEPFMQPDFAMSLLESGKRAGLHICVETCGHVRRETLRESMKYTDIYLYDYKATGTSAHRQFTGVGNSLLLSNLKMLLCEGAEVILRCPMVRGVNDAPEHLEAIAGLCKAYPQLSGVEIMAYHNMGRDKGVRVGLPPERMTDLPLTPEDDKKRWIETLRASGCAIAKIG